MYLYVHFAPPCGTASRARFIKRRFRYNPPILRSDEFPNGLPDLRPDLRARVAAANKLYDVTQKLCRTCHEQGVFFSIENPGRSFFWDTDSIRAFLAEVPHFRTYFHHCQYGSSRRKLTLLVHNIPTFEELQAMCDNQHTHEPWGQTATGWATAEETAYPWELCRAIATKFALFLQQMGALCATPVFATQTLGNKLQYSTPQNHCPWSASLLPFEAFLQTHRFPPTPDFSALHPWGTSRARDTRRLENTGRLKNLFKLRCRRNNLACPPMAFHCQCWKQ